MQYVTWRFGGGKPTKVVAVQSGKEWKAIELAKRFAAQYPAFGFRVTDDKGEVFASIPREQVTS